ncbi:MAG: hypothetical protein H0X30_07515 [Anaerolineae bacterium]|nr:hypothetical protein [Anaerolineae bacterium]
MATSEMGDTILEREFDSTDTDGNKSIIKLRLGIPYQISDSTSSLKWRCAYQIIGKGSEKIKLAQGMDAIDAMLMCIQLADIFMKMYQKDTKITWLDDDWLGLIFPPVSELTEEERKATSEDENSPFKQLFDEFFRNFKGRTAPSNMGD